MWIAGRTGSFGTILELREEKHEAVRNVATSQCRDIPMSRRPNVATSGQHEEEVNKRQRRNISTSQCLNVAMLQRCYVDEPKNSLDF